MYVYIQYMSIYYYCIPVYIFLYYTEGIYIFVYIIIYMGQLLPYVHTTHSCI